MFFHTEDIWGLDLLDLKDYCPEKSGNYRYNLLVIDKFSQFGRTIALKKKNAQTMKNSCENIPISSRRKPK